MCVRTVTACFDYLCFETTMLCKTQNSYLVFVCVHRIKVDLTQRSEVDMTQDILTEQHICEVQ